MPEPAILIDSVAKAFPPARSGWRSFLQPFEKPSLPALSSVSFEVAEGESVALLGANGAGKSTLLRILATLLLPGKGTAKIAGHDVFLEPEAVRRQIGYHAGSDSGFYPRLTARQNLLFFGQLNHLTRSAALERVAELSQLFELNDTLERQVRTLSAGTIQRLSLARALMHRPRVLLLDEPTRSLDVIAAAEFREFLKHVVLASGGTTLLFASHTLPELELLADRIVVLDRGRLLACDTLSRVKALARAATLEEAFFKLTGHTPHSLEAPPA